MRHGARLSSQLWQDPPWEKLKPAGGYQMGLSPVPTNQWLPRLATAAEFARKVGLMRLRQLPVPVYQSLPSATAAAQEAGNFVTTQLALQYGVSVAGRRICPGLPPLVAAAAQIPDDLCLLQLDKGSQQFCLVAASLCSPSYWSLSDKLGLPLSDIHQPVPGLNSQLGDRMHRFFLQMPQRRCFVRQNFFVHAQQDLYQPKPDTADYQRVRCSELMLRSERQSLVRFQDDLVLFSIRVDLAPLAEAWRWPSQAAELGRVLNGLTKAQREAFGDPAKLKAVRRYLAGLALEKVEHH